MQRIAAPMVGGIVSALLLTMLVLPAAYLVWEWQRAQKTMTPSSGNRDDTGAL